jgi:hypothetical protein
MNKQLPECKGIMHSMRWICAACDSATVVYCMTEEGTSQDVSIPTVLTLLNTTSLLIIALR